MVQMTKAKYDMVLCYVNLRYVQMVVFLITVLDHTSVPTLPTHMPPPSPHIPPQYWNRPSTLHGTISQKNII